MGKGCELGRNINIVSSSLEGSTAQDQAHGVRIPSRQMEGRVLDTGGVWVDIF